MIIEALDLVVKEINDAIAPGVTPVPLSLANIARVNDNSTFTSDFTDKLILSIVNFEEDRMAKTKENYYIENNKVKYINPPYHLNLTVIFSATHEYKVAIPYLEQILLFFQAKNVFTPENTAGMATSVPDLEKMMFDLHSLNLEQVHQLWSTLGGHYMPSLVFKLRMLTIMKKITPVEAEPIKKITFKEEGI